MEDEARVSRAALQDMQRASLDAHQRQSSSDDFGLSAFVLARHCDLKFPWPLVGARSDGEDAWVERTCRTTSVLFD